MGAWVLPMPTIDPQIILRSARALERYGPDFTYGHYIAVKNLPQAVGLPLGVAGVFTAGPDPAGAQLADEALPAGHGPERASSARKSLVPRPLHRRGRRQARRHARSSGGDPGYGETSKMLAESALCLAHDDLPQTAGQVTTAQAMGDALTERLQRAGIEFGVLEG